MTGPGRALLLLALLLSLPACGGGEDGAATPRAATDAPSTAPSASSSASTSAPAPGPVPAQVAAEAAGVELPAAATAASATLSRADTGIDVYRLVFTLPGSDELQAFCSSSGMLGPAPLPAPLSARRAEGFGVAPTGPGRLVCNGSLPGDLDVQRDVLALPAGSGLEVRLVTFRMPR